MKALKLTLMVLLLSKSLSANVYRLQPITINLQGSSKEYQELKITELNKNTGDVLYGLNKQLFIRSSFRSEPEVQADVALFGAGFEATGILLQGIPFKSLQTGHHSFQLPISRRDLETVDILDPAETQKYGLSTGVGGLNIFIKPKKQFSLSYGSFGNFDVYLSNGKSRIEYRKSDGYRENTDYRLFSSLVSKKNIIMGFLHKEFGAEDFYGPFNSYERVSRIFVIIKDIHPDVDVKTEILTDVFELFRDDPDFYKNIHNSYNAYVRAKKDIFISGFPINTAINIDYTYIDSRGEGKSTGMGYQDNLDVILNLATRLKRMNLSVATKYNDDYGLFIEPGLSYTFLQRKFNSKLTLSYTRREPSFTERFYKDPIHYGNDVLRPEKNLQIQEFLSINRVRSLLIYRTSVDAIDWVYNSTKGRYYSKNLDYQYAGAFLFFDILKKAKANLSINYAFQKYFNEVQNTKYLFKEPTHKLGITWSINYYTNLTGGLYTDSNMDFKKVLGDLYIQKNIGNYKLSLNIENLFNIKYDYPTGLPARPLSLSFECSYLF